MLGAHRNRINVARSVCTHIKKLNCAHNRPLKQCHVASVVLYSRCQSQRIAPKRVLKVESKQRNITTSSHRRGRRYSKIFFYYEKHFLYVTVTYLLCKKIYRSHYTANELRRNRRRSRQEEAQKTEKSQENARRFCGNVFYF